MNFAEGFFLKALWNHNAPLAEQQAITNGYLPLNFPVGGINIPLLGQPFLKKYITAEQTGSVRVSKVEWIWNLYLNLGHWVTAVNMHI